MDLANSEFSPLCLKLFWGGGVSCEAYGACAAQTLGLRGGGCPGWVSHLGAGSSASGLARTLSAPRVPASASKHPPPGLHTGTFRQPLLRTSSFLSSHAPTHGSNTVGPRPLPLLPSHALYEGSSSQLGVGIGQLSRPTSAEEKEARPEAYCAGVVLSATL